VIIAEGREVEGGRYFAEEEFLLTGDGAADILTGNKAVTRSRLSADRSKG